MCRTPERFRPLNAATAVPLVGRPSTQPFAGMPPPPVHTVVWLNGPVTGSTVAAVNAHPDPPPAGVRRPRRASILDVAALAGVSASTVSRSLRGHSSISAATRQRVLEAARELSYSASPQASGLASGRTRTIGIVVPFVTRWFFVNVVAGAYEVLHEAGYDVLLYHLGTAQSRDRFFERMPLARRVDAVLALTLPLTDEHTLALRALDMPLVTVGAVLPACPACASTTSPRCGPQCTTCSTRATSRSS